MARPRVLLSIDTHGWAFENVARSLVRHLGNEFSFDVLTYPEIKGGTYDLLVSFWWQSAVRARGNLRVGRALTWFCDHYSWRGSPQPLALCLRQSDGVAVANRTLGGSLMPAFTAEGHASVHVCEDAVDTALFTPRPLLKRVVVGWVGNSKAVVTAGGPADLKGLDMLTEACRAADVRLVVQDVSATKPLPIEEMPRWYEQVTVVACASQAEGGPNPILEGMACGRVPVSTPVGIVPEVVTPKCGRVVKRSAADIAAALRELRDMPFQQVAAMGAEARRVVLAHDRGAKMHQWRTALLDTLNGGGRASAGAGPRGKTVAVAGGKPDWTKRVTAFVVSSGEPSRAACLEHLAAQDVAVRVEEIRDVAPMDRAFQAMIDRCETELYVQVDADMLLAPGAVRQLVEAIDAAPGNVAMHCAWLWGDAEERPIQGVKVYRHAIVRQFPYRPSLSCEVPHLQKMAAAGYTYTTQPEPADRAGCAGLHFSLQSPEVAFHRWQRLGQKYRVLPYMAWLATKIPLLRQRFLEAHGAGDAARAEVYEAAWMGALTGLTIEAPADREVDARAPRDGWRRTLPIVGDWSQGPREMSLYVTGKCNAKCTFCRRQSDPSLASESAMSVRLVRMLLDHLTTVRAVCVAGFGEPLLAPDAVAIVKECRARGLYVGLITNGLLLADRAKELAEAGVSRVTVSLNATDAAEYERIHGVPGWDRVLAGVRAMVATGTTTAISYVAHCGNVHRLPAKIALGRELGVASIDLPNILPHAGVDDPWFKENVIRVTSANALGQIDAARQAPGAELVGHWPVPIDPTGECPRRCDSPFMSIGIDWEGMITGCRRVAAPSREHGHFSRPNIWHDLHYHGLRRVQTGDAELPDTCRWCFASWSR